MECQIIFPRKNKKEKNSKCRLLKSLSSMQSVKVRFGSDRRQYACDVLKTSGPSCSKLTMSLVNDSLKFKSSDTQIY